MINDCGIADHRGGVGELDWKLSFWPEYVVDGENGSNVTFHDLIIAAYKIRSHKFDECSEKFCEIDDLTISYDKRGKMVVVASVVFEHK